MVDAILIAKSVTMGENGVEVELSNGVKVTIHSKFKIPKECIGPLMISIIGNRVNIAKIVGPCSLWSTLEITR